MGLIGILITLIIILIIFGVIWQYILPMFNFPPGINNAITAVLALIFLLVLLHLLLPLAGVHVF